MKEKAKSQTKKVQASHFWGWIINHVKKQNNQKHEKQWRQR
jgi:hypothetical protein